MFTREIYILVLLSIVPTDAVLKSNPSAILTGFPLPDMDSVTLYYWAEFPGIEVHIYLVIDKVVGRHHVWRSVTTGKWLKITVRRKILDIEGGDKPHLNIEDSAPGSRRTLFVASSENLRWISCEKNFFCDTISKPLIIVVVVIMIMMFIWAGVCIRVCFRHKEDKRTQTTEEAFTLDRRNSVHPSRTTSYHKK